MQERLTKQRNSDFQSFCRRILEYVNPDEVLACDISRDELSIWDETILNLLQEKYGLNKAQGRELVSLCINIQISQGVEERTFWYKYAAYRKLIDSADSMPENA